MCVCVCVSSGSLTRTAATCRVVAGNDHDLLKAAASDCG
jgi:hypothetical protein